MIRQRKLFRSVSGIVFSMLCALKAGYVVKTLVNMSNDYSSSVIEARMQFNLVVLAAIFAIGFLIIALGCFMSRYNLSRFGLIVFIIANVASIINVNLNSNIQLLRLLYDETYKYLYIEFINCIIIALILICASIKRRQAKWLGIIGAVVFIIIRMIDASVWSSKGGISFLGRFFTDWLYALLIIAGAVAFGLWCYFPTLLKTETWECPDCGKHNPKNIITCSNCGKIRI